MEEEQNSTVSVNIKYTLDDRRTIVQWCKQCKTVMERNRVCKTIMHDSTTCWTEEGKG